MHWSWFSLFVQAVMAFAEHFIFLSLQKHSLGWIPFHSPQSNEIYRILITINGYGYEQKKKRNGYLECSSYSLTK